MNNNIEFSVGLPMMKCSSNPSNAYHNKYKTNADGTKTLLVSKKSVTCSTRLCVDENLNRIGQDPDIDTEKSHLNVNLTDITIADDFMEELEEFKAVKNKELQDKGYKKMRSDTVDNVSIIIKPNIEAMHQLQYDEQVRFLSDSKKSIEKIFKDNINPNFKFTTATCHFDEGNPHMHCNFKPLIFDEKKQMEVFNAKQFLSLKNKTILNKNYSKEMQALGWNVKDMNIYEEMTPKEKEEYKKNKKKMGKSSLEYKSDKIKKLDKENKKLESKLSENTEYVNFTDEELKNKNEEFKQLQASIQKLSDEKGKTTREIEEYKKEQETKVKIKMDKTINEITKNPDFSTKYEQYIRNVVYEEEKEKAIKEVAQMSDNEIIKEQGRTINILQHKIYDLKDIIKNIYENVKDTIKYVIKNKIFDRQERIQDNFNNMEEEQEQVDLERNQELDNLLEELEEEPEEEL